MRLLHSRTLELKSFAENSLPLYAVLSHTWGEEEVSFQDLKDDVRVSERLGYVKLQQSCELAASMGLEYIWIDTCCIDKSSSAELSEAINSMFRWYSSSSVCIAFLSDVTSPPKTDGKGLDSSFRGSRWFTRGWTLQELIAPNDVIFYTRDWIRLGTRSSLKKKIHEITGIPHDLFDEKPEPEDGTIWEPVRIENKQLEKLNSFSVAEKMRWAARRETTRPEDVAYCLMGIFDINMPLLYGEGQRKAFKRLQEEIIKSTDDESVFAWRIPRRIDTKHFNGLLADSPAAFDSATSHGDLSNLLVKRSTYLTRRSGLSTVMTNRGVHLELRLSPLPGDESGTIYLAFLDCEMRRPGGQAAMNTAILLQRTSWDSDTHFVRIRTDILALSLMNSIIFPDRLLQIMGDNKTRPFQEVAPRQIFVPHNQPEIRYPKGIIFHPKIQYPEETPYRIEVCSRSPTWQYFVQDAAPALESYEINFDLAPAPSVEQLMEPKVLGVLELYVEAIYGSHALKVCLVTGLEPLPPNPFGTPSLYFVPWYAFEEQEPIEKGDYSGVLDKEKRLDRLQMEQTLIGSFELESKYSRLFYCVNIRVKGRRPR